MTFFIAVIFLMFLTSIYIKREAIIIDDVIVLWYKKIWIKKNE